MLDNLLSFPSIHGYADDIQLKINTKVDDVNVAIQKVNKDLNSISTYCRNNALKINESKCYFITIGTKPAIKKIR